MHHYNNINLFFTGNKFFHWNKDSYIPLEIRWCRCWKCCNRYASSEIIFLSRGKSIFKQSQIPLWNWNSAYRSIHRFVDINIHMSKEQSFFPKGNQKTYIGCIPIEPSTMQCKFIPNIFQSLIRLLKCSLEKWLTRCHDIFHIKQFT